MNDAVDAAPFGQYLHKRSGREHIPAVRHRQQRDSGSLARGRYQDLEAACRYAGLYGHGDCPPVFRCKVPGPATLLLLMKNGKFAKLRGCGGFIVPCHEGRTCNEDPPAHADPLHLKVGVGIESFTDADCYVDSLMNAIDPSIGYDALEAQHRMDGKECRQRSRDGVLEPEGTAQPNEPARLGLHSKRCFLRRVGFDDGPARMFEDLLTDLCQTEPPRRSIQQPHAQALFQQRDTPAYPRFWNAEHARRRRKPAILNNGRKELEIVQVVHHGRRLPPKDPTLEPTRAD
jgi:hypothetical protein